MLDFYLMTGINSLIIKRLLFLRNLTNEFQTLERMAFCFQEAIKEKRRLFHWPCYNAIGEEGNGKPPHESHFPRKNSEPCLWFLLRSKSSMQRSSYLYGVHYEIHSYISTNSPRWKHLSMCTYGLRRLRKTKLFRDE